MKADRREFIKKMMLGLLGAVTLPPRKVWSLTPFAFWKSPQTRGTAQITQLVVKAGLLGGSTSIRTTQMVAKVATVGGGSAIRTTQVIAKVVVVP